MKYKQLVSTQSFKRKELEQRQKLERIQLVEKQQSALRSLAAIHQNERSNLLLDLDKERNAWRMTINNKGNAFQERIKEYVDNTSIELANQLNESSPNLTYGANFETINYSRSSTSHDGSIKTNKMNSDCTNGLMASNELKIEQACESLQSEFFESQSLDECLELLSDNFYDKYAKPKDHFHSEKSQIATSQSFPNTQTNPQTQVQINETETEDYLIVKGIVNSVIDQFGVNN
jgi:hypothetical protein